MREVAILSAACRHPHVIGYLGVARHGKELWSACWRWLAVFAHNACRLVLELAKLGSMFDLVVTRGEFSEPRDLPRLLRMMAGAAAGLLHLHACSPPIIHRDIALRNLFVAADHQVKASTVPPPSQLALCVLALCECCVLWLTAAASCRLMMEL